jgi:hypothetical protein
VIRSLLFTEGAVTTLAFAPAAFADPSLNPCKASGTAAVSPALTTAAQDFSYAFHADLTCAGTPGSGTAHVGERLTIGGIEYLAPAKAHGNGTCASSTASGDAIVQWAGGGITIYHYDTTANSGLQGTVKPTIQLTRVEKDPQGNPIVNAINTTVFGDGYVYGLFSLTPASPADCTTGVTAPAVNGGLCFLTAS